MRSFLMILSLVFGPALGCCGNLWLIEHDFVKFGKKEIYEKYKKEMLAKEIEMSFPIFGIQAEDSLQYIYLIPIKDYCGLGDFVQQRTDDEQALDADVKVPYLSTLNFTMRSLQQYLPDCSYIPQGKEALTAYLYLYFYLFGIAPGDEEIFEARLQKIAEEQARDSGICFRTWKVLIGPNTPKYLVAVFATSEKQVQRQAEKLEFINAQMKNILRTQKQGTALWRKDLSVLRAYNGH